MKSSIHPPEYRPVVYSDEAAGFAFLTQSCAQTTETIDWEDGKEYPLIKIHISSASHPFFTGEEKIIDTEGRVDRFKAKFAAGQKHQEELAKKQAETKKPAAKKAETKIKPEDKTKAAKPVAKKAEPKAKATEKKTPKPKTEAKK